MQCHLQLDNNALEQIILKLTYMSISNIKWSCLFSGCGVLHILTQKDAKKLFSSALDDDDSSIKDLYENLAVLKCIYKKGSPSFTKPPEEILNPGKYMWNFSSFNKTIEPATQSAAISSLCLTADAIYSEQKHLGMLMVKNAAVYYDFMTTYMRDDNGFFIAIEDKTKNPKDEFKIKQITKKIRLTDQLLVYEGMLHLYHITSRHELKEYYTGDCVKYLAESRNIFSYILEDYDDLVSQSSRDISTCISSLSRCCRIETDENMAATYRQIIMMLCAEIETRIKITGEVEKDSQSLSTATPGTHFKIAAALLEGYLETGIEKFKEIAMRVYNNLLDLFDPSLGIFILKSPSKQSCNLRDIADTLKSLFLLYITDKDDKVADILLSFYTVCFEKNGVIKCVPEKKANLFNYEISINEEIPLMSETQKAPVFMKNIKFDFKNIPSVSTSKHFNSHYALYTSSTILFYLTPLIISGLQ